MSTQDPNTEVVAKQDSLYMSVVATRAASNVHRCGTYYNEAIGNTVSKKILAESLSCND